MTQCTATFESGTSGNALATGDAASGTAYDSVTTHTPIGTQSSVTYSTTHVHSGSLSAKYDFPHNNSPDTCAFAWTTSLGSISEHYGRIYIYLTANPNVVFQILLESDGVGRAMKLQVNSAGKIVAAGDGANLGTSTSALTLNSWNRIEWHHKDASGTSGIVVVQLFLGTNADGSTPDDTSLSFTATSAGSGGNLTNVTIGDSDSGQGVDTFSAWFDDVVVGAASFPGPSGGSSNPYGYDKIRTDLQATQRAALFCKAFWRHGKGGIFLPEKLWRPELWLPSVA